MVLAIGWSLDALYKPRKAALAKTAETERWSEQRRPLLVLLGVVLLHAVTGVERLCFERLCLICATPNDDPHGTKQMPSLRLRRLTDFPVNRRKRKACMSLSKVSATPIPSCRF